MFQRHQASPTGVSGLALILLSFSKTAHFSGRAGTPSRVMRIGLMKPSSSNSIRSMQVTRELPSVSPSGRR